MCDEPPDEDDAEKTYTGVQPGDIANYTCDSDFKACRDKTTITCRASGRWDTMDDDLCSGWVHRDVYTVWVGHLCNVRVHVRPKVKTVHPR